MIQLSLDPRSLSMLDQLLVGAERETKRRLPEIARFPQAQEEAHQKLHRIRDCRAQIAKAVDAMRTANVQGGYQAAPGSVKPPPPHGRGSGERR